jgi:hypothetical protein
MHHRRAFAVLLTSALSLQLALAGNGETCVGGSLGDRRTGVTMSESAMREMGLPGSVAQEASRDEGSAPARNQQPPCDRSPAGISCQLFASCAAGFVIAETSEAIGHQARAARARLTDSASLSSRTIVPELPPPRA